MKMLKIIALVGIIAAAGGYEQGMFGLWAMLIRIFWVYGIDSIACQYRGGGAARAVLPKRQKCELVLGA